MNPMRSYLVAAAVALAVAAALLSPAAAHAESFLVFKDDRAGFTAALDDGARSVTDSGGTFAPDPVTGSVALLSRSGTIAGQAYVYTLYDFDFSNTPDGTLTSGGGVGDIADTDNVTVESPAAQGGASGLGTWGVDAGTGQTSTRNALLARFSTTPGGLGIGHFGLDLIDFEIPVGSLGGAIRLYDDGVLSFSHSFDWGGTTGDAETHFLGIVAVDDGSGQAARFDQAVFVIGTNTDSYAADRFTFGAAIHNPEPGTIALFALGAAGLALVVRRRAARRRPAEGSPGGGPSGGRGSGAADATSDLTAAGH